MTDHLPRSEEISFFATCFFRVAGGCFLGEAEVGVVALGIVVVAAPLKIIVVAAIVIVIIIVIIIVRARFPSSSTA